MMEPQRSHPRARSGFGILALIVMVGIVAALMVASLPVLIRMDRLDRVQRTAVILTDLDTLINNGAGTIEDFNTRVGRNPGSLSQLTIPIAVADLNACGPGNAYTAGQVTNWQTWGPFGTYYIDPAVGLRTPIGTANNLMVRSPTGANSTLSIVFPNIDFADVEALDQLMELLPADLGSASGLIRWTAPAADGTTTMSYVSPINNQC